MNLKRIAAVLVLLCMVVCMLPSTQTTAATMENHYAYEITDGRATITSYNGPGGDITIPSILGGYPVTGIGADAFNSCSEVISVTIPESVISIDDWAFSFCTGLTTVTIPNSVISIGEGAFNSCTKLVSLSIPNSVTNIGEAAFYCCKSLANVEIGNGLTCIGENLFGECTRLSSVKIGDCVACIGDYAFAGCNNLTSITIPNSVTSIGGAAFENCYCLAAIKIGANVAQIGECAFAGCKSLTSITIPNSVKSIGSSAFVSCENLTAVYISDLEVWCNISFADYLANPLYYAHNLYFNDNLVTNLQIPDGVTSVNDNAFLFCTSLTSVTVPASVINIGDDAFGYCIGIVSVVMDYGVTTIGSGAFLDCSSLVSVTIPSSITDIGEWAFCSCASLTNVIYCGTEEQWNNINIDNDNTQNTYFINAQRQYHDYQEATCTISEICTICGMTGSEALGHNGTWQQIIAPSCTDGLEACICETCGETVTRPIPATHRFENGACADCGYTTIGNSVTFDFAASNPGLSNGNYTDVMLENTGIVKVDVYKAMIRNEIRLYINASAKEGESYLVVKSGKAASRLILSAYYPSSSNGSNMIRVSGSNDNGTTWICLGTSPATTTSATTYSFGDGSTYTWFKIEIVKNVVDYTQVRIPKLTLWFAVDEDHLDHNYEAVITAPTCTTDGYTTHTCVTCGDSYVDSYVEAGHSYETTVTAPTCTERGYTTYACTVCGNSYVDDYVDTKGHTWSAWVPMQAATCTAEGSQLRFCNCGAQETENIEMLPHSYENGVCTDCGENESHDHIWENGACLDCEITVAEVAELSGDGKISAFDAQLLAEAKAGLRQLTDEQWEALGDLTVSDIIDYILGRFPGMATEE